MKFSGKVKWLMITLVATGSIGAVLLYTQAYASNTGFEEESRIIYVTDTIRTEDWMVNLDESVISNKSTFLRVAGWKKLNRIYPGRYKIKRGMNNNAIINMLRIGSQAGISIRIDDCQSIYDLAGRLGKYLKADSSALISVFRDNDVCSAYGFSQETIGCLIVPDTYEFLWTNTPQDILKRMEQLRKKYWTDDKVKRAKEIGMTQTEVCILASIVKAECSRKDEAPKIAGLYLNRLRIDMPLQADPTALFAKGIKGANRVYTNDTEFISPYNTYQNKGLTPGPIRFVENNFLDAVLFADQNDFLYMCAQPGATGYHNFSKTYDQHLEYQQSYVEWLNKKGIR